MNSTVKLLSYKLSSGTSCMASCIALEVVGFWIAIANKTGQGKVAAKLNASVYLRAF